MKLEEIDTFTVHKLDASVPSSLGTFVHTPFFQVLSPEFGHRAWVQDTWSNSCLNAMVFCSGSRTPDVNTAQRFRNKLTHVAVNLQIGHSKLMISIRENAKSLSEVH